MNNILKVSLIIITIPLVIAAFLNNDLVYEKSILIEAPIDSVWEHTNSLSDLDNWSPWNAKDPNMTKEWSGVDGTVGAVQSWNSKVEGVGKGSQTIANIQAPNLLETSLKFYTPEEMESAAYIKLTDAEKGTTVTWGFVSELPYPFNIMIPFMNMEKHLGEDWSTGLNNLKDICEE